MVRRATYQRLLDPSLNTKASGDLSRLLQRQRAILETVKYSRARRRKSKGRAQKQTKKEQPRSVQQQPNPRKSGSNIADSSFNDHEPTEPTEPTEPSTLKQYLNDLSSPAVLVQLGTEPVTKLHRKHIDDGLIHRISEERGEFLVSLIGQVTASGVHQEKVR